MTTRSLIHIENCQIKSERKLYKFIDHIDKLEKGFGIKEVEISFKNLFVCPDIDLTEFANSSDPMTKLIGNLLIKLDKQKYGKDSKYEKK